MERVGEDTIKRSGIFAGLLSNWLPRPPAHHRATHKSLPELVIATFKLDFACWRKFVMVRINNIPAHLRFTTGSDITLLSERKLKRIGQPQVKPTEHWARNVFDGEPTVSGTVVCNVVFSGLTAHLTCYLASCSNLNLLGLDWINKLNCCKGILLSHASSSTQHSEAPSSKLTFRIVYLGIFYNAVYLYSSTGLDGAQNDFVKVHTDKSNNARPELV
ncbi:hypothetical protein CLF_102113 [Clonorchis sinensis]|uniref:Uncharacterized protein n=1 Tax=Clonorchis sinensis TaxID=79923 RepID=G7Y7B4_CLOSI|nr:hypothetical protein CLF_102113 [Clonorchis sinensis]